MGWTKNLIISLYSAATISLFPEAFAEDGSKYEIAIDTKARELFLYKEGKEIKNYPVGIGKNSNPTPKGDFKIVSMVDDPEFYNKKKGIHVKPGDPRNPVSKVWMSLNKPHYGIHGTNDLESIGKNVSEGCIRMYNDDIKDLESEILDYFWIYKEVPVKIK